MVQTETGLGPAEVGQESPLLDPREAFRRLGISKATGYQMLESGALPAERSGRLWLISRRVFEEWLRTLGTPESPTLRRRAPEGE